MISGLEYKENTLLEESYGLMRQKIKTSYEPNPAVCIFPAKRYGSWRNKGCAGTWMRMNVPNGLQAILGKTSDCSYCHAPDDKVAVPTLAHQGRGCWLSHLSPILGSHMPSLSLWLWWYLVGCKVLGESIIKSEEILKTLDGLQANN